MKYLKLKFLLMFFALAMAIPPAWAGEVTFTAGTDTSDGLSITKDGITLTLTSGTLSRTDNYRVYSGGKATVSSTVGNITKIVFNCTGSGNGDNGPGKLSTTSGYSFSGNVGTWNGSASSIVFSASAQVRITSFTVTYESSGPPPTAKPTFSVPAGTYYEPKSVSISCATEGATIRYTTNGDTPDENSAIYSTPITVDETMTIKAIAMKDGYSNSAIAEAAYEIIDPSTLTTYRKITSTSELTNGDYLIVCESQNVAFDGSLSDGNIDKTLNSFSVNPQDGVIRTNKAGYFTIKAISGSQQRSIRSASGVAIGKEVASNGMDHTDGDQVYPNTITFDNGNAVIKGEGLFNLMYYNSGSNSRFRYYNNNQTAIQLYKKDSNDPVITVVPEDGVIINDATGDDNRTRTLTATLTNGQDELTATMSSSLWSWADNVASFDAYTYYNNEENKDITYLPLHDKSYVTFSSTNATDVAADLEYNYTGPLYILGYVNGGDWSANNMVQMDGPDADGIYSVTLPITPNGNNNSEISFSKRKGTEWYSWSEIRDYRFVPVSNGPWGLTESTLGGWHSLDFNPQHVDNQKIVLPAATYTISIDAKNNTFKIERYQQTVETPTFSVAEGTYTEDQTVEITCATDGATIHYTLDGSDPNENSAVYSTPLSVTATTTIKAIAMKDGWASSAIASVTYTINKPKIYNKVTHPSQLIAGKKYLLVNEDKKKYCGEITLSGSNYIGSAVDGPAITEGSVDIYGYNDIKELTLGNDEGWTFHNGDGYLHYPGGNQLDVVSEVSNGQAKWTVSSSDDGFILTNAYNTDRVLQYNSSSPRFACYTSAQSPAVLYVEDGVEPVLPTKVETPTFSIEAGTYNEAKTVEISCGTSGATIYYTTDGSTPTNESAVYSTAIPVNKTMTIKAFATMTGMDDSELAEATYTIIYDANNLAAAKALGDDQEFNFTGNVVVTFKQAYTTSNGAAHTLIGLRDKDATEGGGVFHNAKASIYGALDKGKVLNPGWTADKETHEGWIQFEAIDNVTTAENTVEVQPFDRTGQTLTTANQSEYIILNNVTINGTTATVNTGAKATATYTLYDLFNNDEVTIADGQYKSLVGVVGVNGETVYVYPLELEKAQVATPTITPNGGEFTSAQEVTFTTTTEGAETWYSLDNENWTKAATYTVDRSGKIYVKATKEGWTDSEVAEATFTINYAPITVTIEPNEQTYTVGDEAKVKVTVTGTVGNDATVTYMFGENTPATVDDEGYVTIPTTEAGTVTLTVTASDSYHSVPVTETGTYTINKALSVTLNPANNEYTVGDEAKVKVTVENAVGEYVVSGKIGEKDYDVDVNGYITLPNDKVVEEMILTVTAIDDRENAVVATATGTYKFNAAPAITFDLEIVPEAENNTYAVGDEVKVKATNIKNTFGDYEVTYMVGQNKLTPNNDGYVTITSAVADEVNLTVSVNDLFEHESEATQTVKFTFDKKAATVEYSAETGTATFGAEPENLPKLTVTPTGLPVIYESTNTAVATVNENGEVSIKGAGKTTISAAFKGNDMYEPASDSYELTVEQGATGLSFIGENPELTLGDNFTAPTLNNPNELPVTWSSDNESVATVDAEGNVTIVGPGTAHITATYTAGEDSNYATGSATYTITVNDVEVNIAKPTFAPAGDTYTEPKWVAIACATPDVNIEYKIGENGTWTKYEKPFEINESCKVYAKASKSAKVVYNDSEVAEAEYTINAKAPAAIENNYYNLINNGLPNKFANVAGRRTLNFVDNPDAEAGTIFRIATDGNGKVLTLRSQACDIQDYAKRAMNYVPTIVQTVINKLNTMEGVDDATGAGSILGQNGLDSIMAAFNKGFDYNLYVEGNENAYRIYARTPSMQNVVDFYAEHKAQVDEKLPYLEGYINQVLAKIRSKVPSNMNANVFEPFSLLTVWEEMGGDLIKPEGDNVMRFYEQVLTNKEYVWNFAKTTAKHYLDNIKDTQTYQGLVAQYPDINIYVSKLEEIRPETKFFIIQNGNEPDYVGETHTYIVNDYAQTYWTLAERTDYDVTFPAENVYNGQLVTTLYTDFAYDVPNDVTAYTVTGVKTVNEKPVAELTAIGKNVPAQTPVLLMTPAAKADVTKTVTLNTNDGTPIENELKGPDYAVKYYGITSPTVEFIFNTVAGLVPADMLAQYEYLKLRTSGTVNNKYFWNVNDALDFGGDCIVRSLAVKDGELAFNEHWKTETNKAFLVSEDENVRVIYLAEAVKPTFDPFPGSYNEAQTVKIDAGGAAIQYSTDGGETWNDYTGPITVDKDMTIIAKTEGVGETAEATGVYVINKPVETIEIDGFKGYFQIKNNGNDKYANVAGRKTLNFVDDPADKAGTVIYADIQTDGKVISLRSQAADLQRYADRAMSYVPEIVELVAEKLNADGSGQILGEHGLDAIMEKFNESFDHHLYVEPAEGGYRIFGRTPSMQPVVDFYRENKDRVEAKLPDLETFINNALRKLRERIGGSSVFTNFSLHQIWENMSTTLTEPTDDVTTMTFYREVLNNKNYVWDFAYQTALIYLNNVKNHPRWAEIEAQLGEYAQYIDMLEQVHPEFKYYIVQKDGKPDFISEGNTDIINNAARTIWTVEPRTTFTVNIAGELFGCPLDTIGIGGYLTTNYTDFAYDLPEGVTAYKVIAIVNDTVPNGRGKAKIVALTGTIPAQTPVLLAAKDAKDYQLKLAETGTADLSGNLLVGPDYLINEYGFKTEQVQGIFDMIKQKLGEDFYNAYVAQYEHLADLNSGTVNNKYFWSVDNYLDNLQGDCIVRSLATDENGELAFSEHWKTETNKAFMVSETFDVITLPINKRYDVNHDGLVNIKDVIDLVDRLLVVPDADHLKACPYCSDIDENGNVHINDVIKLIDILLGVDHSNQTTNPEEGEGGN